MTSVCLQGEQGQPGQVGAVGPAGPVGANVSLRFNSVF